MVGLCTGMLPGAALAFASSTTQLLELAPEIVCVLLRLGLEASRRSAQIEKSYESWATVVPGLPLQEQREILHQFHYIHVRTLYLLLCHSTIDEVFDRLYPQVKEPTSVQSLIRRRQSVGHLLHKLHSSHSPTLSGIVGKSPYPSMQRSMRLT